MESLIEQIYKGDFKTEEDLKLSKKADKILDKLIIQDDQIRIILSNKQYQKHEEICNLHEELSAERCLQCYVESFKAGFRIALNVFENTP